MKITNFWIPNNKNGRVQNSRILSKLYSAFDDFNVDDICSVSNLNTFLVCISAKTI